MSELEQFIVYFAIPVVALFAGIVIGAKAGIETTIRIVYGAERDKGE